MHWFYIHTSTLDSEAFVDAEPVDRATWLMLMRYCVGQENLGRIEGAKSWSDRKWQQVAKVTLREVLRTCRLWFWDGEALLVEFYPVAKQIEHETKSKAGRDTAAKRWGKPSSTPPLQQPSSPDSSATPTATAELPRQQDAEGKVREEKVTPQPPQGGAERSESLCANELPQWEQVLAFVEKWPGEPASGAPRIPVEWAEKWYARLMSRHSTPMDWKRLLVACWRAAFRSHPVNHSRRAGSKVSPELRRLDATRRIEALGQAIERSPANAGGPCWNPDHEPSEREKLEKWRGERKRLRDEILEV